MDGANHIILHWIYCLFKNGLLESNFNAMSNKHKKFCICPSVVITIYIQVIFKYIIIGNDFLFQADYNEFRFIILSIGRGAMQVYALKKLVFSTWLFWFNSIYWKTKLKCWHCVHFIVGEVLHYIDQYYCILHFQQKHLQAQVH